MACKTRPQLGLNDSQGAHKFDQTEAKVAVATFQRKHANHGKIMGSKP
jgi:hypothetical protein